MPPSFEKLRLAALEDGSVSLDEAKGLSAAAEDIVNRQSSRDLKTELQKGGWSPANKASREQMQTQLAQGLEALTDKAADGRVVEALEMGSGRVRHYAKWDEGIRGEPKEIQQRMVKFDTLVEKLEAFVKNPKNKALLSREPFNQISWSGPHAPKVVQFMGHGDPALRVTSKLPKPESDAELTQLQESLRTAVAQLIKRDPSLKVGLKEDPAIVVGFSKE